MGLTVYATIRYDTLQVFVDNGALIFAVRYNTLQVFIDNGALIFAMTRWLHVVARLLLCCNKQMP